MPDLRGTRSPYVAGTILTLSPHTPPTVAQAEGSDHTAEARQLAKALQTRDIEVSPKAALTTRDSDSNTCCGQLEIIEPITVHQNDAQVVLCKATLALGEPPVRVVAKIFDPRFYSELECDESLETLATLAQYASTDYSRETAAYRRIESRKTTRPYHCTLDYFGSWSFQLVAESSSWLSSASGTATQMPEVQTHHRTVTLLLLEYVQGCTLQEIAHHAHLDEAFRLYVWTQFCECEAWLEHIGVHHRDLALHNVMLDPSPPLPPQLPVPGSTVNEQHQVPLQPRVVLIDFGLSEVLDSNVSRGETQEGSEDARLPKSPILNYWGSMLGFSEWCPDWFIGDLPLRRRWLMRKYGDDTRYRRINEPLDPDSLDDWARLWMKDHDLEPK